MFHDRVAFAAGVALFAHDHVKFAAKYDIFFA
jgi:hypothetical protein